MFIGVHNSGHKSTPLFDRDSHVASIESLTTNNILMLGYYRDFSEFGNSRILVPTEKELQGKNNG